MSVDAVGRMTTQLVRLSRDADEEELGMHLIWLEVSDVQDPQVSGIASDGRRQLIVGLSTEG